MASSKPTPKAKRQGIAIERPVHTRLVTYAEAMGMKVHRVAEAAIEEFLNRKAKEKTNANPSN